MKSGPRPKPPKLKVIEGNPGHRPIPELVEPAPGLPACPKWLTAEAKAEWRRIVPQLDKLGLLAKVDRAVLTAYCEAWSRLRSATLDVSQNGIKLKTERQRFSRNGDLLATDVVVVKNPAVQIAHEASEQVRRFAGEFGLSPASRLPAKSSEDEDSAVLDG